jgi:hypothetical protein
MRAILPLLVAGIIAGSSLAGAANRLPAFKAERWVNSAPLTAEGLRDKVVLVDFWEYTCTLNCPKITSGSLSTSRSAPVLAPPRQCRDTLEARITTQKAMPEVSASIQYP